MFQAVYVLYYTILKRNSIYCISRHGFFILQFSFIFARSLIFSVHSLSRTLCDCWIHIASVSTFNDLVASVKVIRIPDSGLELTTERTSIRIIKPTTMHNILYGTFGIRRCNRWNKLTDKQDIYTSTHLPIYIVPTSLHVQYLCYLGYITWIWVVVFYVCFIVLDISWWLVYDEFIISNKI